MTKKLYDLYPYQTEFSASILSCQPCEQGYDVILNQTLFFPEEGGQSSDRGSLNNITVKDVQINNGTIHHYTDTPLEGEIKGCIDWKHRYSNMQNHSGEHILSGLVHSIFGFNNVGFHLGNDEVTADYDGMLSNEDIQLLEKKVNEVITQNINIQCSYPDNVETIDYRSKKEIKEAIRIVEIPNIDVCACCAPHVQSTIEVGLLKILKVMKRRKGCRVFFLCGQRAIEDYKIKHEQAVKVSNLFSVPVDSIYEGAKHSDNEVHRLLQEISSLKKEIIDMHCKECEPKNRIIRFVEDIDANTQKYYVTQLMNYVDDYAAVFAGTDSKYRFLLVSKKDARNQLKQLKEHFNVRGGGKQDNIQGTIEATKEEILNILK